MVHHLDGNATGLGLVERSRRTAPGFPPPVFEIIEQGAVPIGRIVIDPGTTAGCIVDFVLASERRSSPPCWSASRAGSSPCCARSSRATSPRLRMCRRVGFRRRVHRLRSAICLQIDTAHSCGSSRRRGPPDQRADQGRAADGEGEGERSSAARSPAQNRRPGPSAAKSAYAAKSKRQHRRRSGPLRFRASWIETLNRDCPHAAGTRRHGLPRGRCRVAAGAGVEVVGGIAQRSVASRPGRSLAELSGRSAVGLGLARVSCAGRCNQMPREPGRGVLRAESKTHRWAEAVARRSGRRSTARPRSTRNGTTGQACFAVDLMETRRLGRRNVNRSSAGRYPVAAD